MRTARIKVDHANTWYHCFNRTAGTSKDRPFGHADKEQFVRFLHRVSQLYGVRVISYQVMSNHFHLLLHAPVELPSAKEMCRRYKAFHRGKRILVLDSPECLVWRQRSRDISWFMRHLQHLFTVWYNRTRPVRRRGSLWADRFKHSILESGRAVWACWKYIENNPVRAGIVEYASDYRFCSYGVWRQSGSHPFAENVTSLILPLMGVASMKELQDLFCNELDEAVPPCKSDGFSETVRCRVRYWTDGLVIGSELFVRQVMAHHHRRSSNHRLAHTTTNAPPIFAWRRLRPA